MSLPFECFPTRALCAAFFAFSFVPLNAQSCPIVSYGPSCGPRLKGSLTHSPGSRRLTVELDSAPRLAIGVFVVGTQLRRDPIGARGMATCWLLNNAQVVMPFATDGNGRSRRSYEMAMSRLGLVYVQDVLLSSLAPVRFESSNGLQLGPWSGEQTLSERFASARALDPKSSSARWASGQLITGSFGGSGVLGSFVASDGKPDGKDAQGRSIYVWDVDNMLVPASRTLTGADLRVRNGVFEFLDLHVAANEAVHFVGTQAVKISVSGELRIDGAMRLVVPEVTKSDDLKAERGGAGGPGGARGGDGGQHSSGIDGKAGGDVTVPRGHPRASQVGGTAGQGSLAHPKSGLAKDIVWIIESGFKLMTRMTAAGGAGGSLYDDGSRALLGKPGIAKRAITRPPFWPFQPGELGPSSTPGKAFPVLPNDLRRSSLSMFAIGGSGGGGAGTHPLYTADFNRVRWSGGGAGAGGGGSLALQAGRDFIVARAAEIDVRGGDARDQGDNSKSPPVRSPGGGGSGGSCLAQAGQSFFVDGLVDARGGAGGQLRETSPFLLYTAADGGDGGAGYLRFEAPKQPDPKLFARCQPSVTAKNVAVLRSLDARSMSVGTSRWHFLPLAGPSFVRYRIEAKVDGKTVVFSDDPKLGRRAAPGEAVIASFQSGKVDASGKLVALPSPWVEGHLAPLNTAPRASNGLRFALRLDLSRAQRIEIVRVDVTYGC